MILGVVIAVSFIFLIAVFFIFKKKSVSDEQIKKLLHQGELKQAKKRLQAAIAYSDNPDYHFWLAKVYEAEFNFEHAVLEYKIILKIGNFTIRTTYQKVLAKLVEAYKKLNNIKSAVHFLETEKKKNRSDNVLLYLAHLYNLLNQTERSAPLVEHLLKKNPNNPDVLTELGVIELEKGNDSRALEIFENSIRINNKNYYAFFYMAQLLQKKGMLDKAILSYERSKNLPCLKLKSLRKMGECYKAKEMLKNASDTYEQAVSEWENHIFYQEITPVDEILQIRYNLAECYILDKNYQGALDQWRIIQSVKPDYKDVADLIQSNARFGRDRIQDFLITSDTDFKKIIMFTMEYWKIEVQHISFFDKEIISVEGRNSGKPILIWAVRSSNPAGEKIVINFYQKMQEKKIHSGMILSANGFSPNGIRSSLGKPIKLLGKGPMLKILKAYENRV